MKKSTVLYAAERAVTICIEALPISVFLFFLQTYETLSAVPWTKAVIAYLLVSLVSGILAAATKNAFELVNPKTARV